MENLMGLLEAYEHASFVGLPTVEMHTNKDRAKKIISVMADHLVKECDLLPLSVLFIEVLNAYAHEQEDLFEEVERFRVQASNRFERYDILKATPTSSSGSKSRAKKGKYQKFPKATKNMLKDWLFDNQDNPYPHYTYPSEEEKTYLCEITGVSLAQINQWFINGRRRILNMNTEERKSLRKRRNSNSDDAEFSKPRREPRAKRIKKEESDEEYYPVALSTPEPTSELPMMNTTCPMPPPLPYASDLGINNTSFMGSNYLLEHPMTSSSMFSSSLSSVSSLSSISPLSLSNYAPLSTLAPLPSMYSISSFNASSLPSPHLIPSVPQQPMFKSSLNLHPPTRKETSKPAPTGDMLDGPKKRGRAITKIEQPAEEFTLRRSLRLLQKL